MITQQMAPRISGRDDLRGCIDLVRVGSALRSGDTATVRALEARGIRVQEAQGTTDFAFMADTIDRGVKAGYLNEMIPITYPTLGYRRDSRTFEAGADHEMNGAHLMDRVAEFGEYLPEEPQFAEYAWHMAKYGRTYAVSWEAWLRDGRDLNLIHRYPETWGLSVRYTREYLFTQAFCANATLYTAAQGNLADDALDSESLAVGINWLRSGPTDPAGNAIAYGGPIYLVVPPALEFAAKALVASSVVVGATDGPANNPMYGAAQVVVNHFLPVIDTTNGDTGWYLFAAPQIRPHIRYGYLGGYEQPEIWVRDTDARTLANGSEDAFAGSWANDSIEFKLRMTFAADPADYRGGYYSDGTT